MKGFTRLYDEGGDIISNFYPSNTSTASLWPGDGRTKVSKKAKRYNKRNILCKGSKCYNPNR